MLEELKSLIVQVLNKAKLSEEVFPAVVLAGQEIMSDRRMHSNLFPRPKLPGVMSPPVVPAILPFNTVSSRYYDSWGTKIRIVPVRASALGNSDSSFFVPDNNFE